MMETVAFARVAKVVFAERPPAMGVRRAHVDLSKSVSMICALPPSAIHQHHVQQDGAFKDIVWMAHHAMAHVATGRPTSSIRISAEKWRGPATSHAVQARPKWWSHPANSNRIYASQEPQNARVWTLWVAPLVPSRETRIWRSSTGHQSSRALTRTMVTWFLSLA